MFFRALRPFLWSLARWTCAKVFTITVPGTKSKLVATKRVLRLKKYVEPKVAFLRAKYLLFSKFYSVYLIITVLSWHVPTLSIVFTRKMLAQTEFSSARHVMTMMTPSGVTKPCGYCHRSQRKTHWQHLTFAIPLLRDRPWACVCASSLRALAYAIDKTLGDTSGRFLISVPVRLRWPQRGPL